MGDVNESIETCEYPWYKAFSAICGFSSAGAGGILGGVLAGGAAAFTTLTAFIAAGATAAFIIGFCSCKLSGRLKRDPREDITVTGLVIDIGRSPMSEIGFLTS